MANRQSFGGIFFGPGITLEFDISVVRLKSDGNTMPLISKQVRRQREPTIRDGTCMKRRCSDQDLWCLMEIIRCGILRADLSGRCVSGEFSWRAIGMGSSAFAAVDGVEGLFLGGKTGHRITRGGERIRVRGWDSERTVGR